MALEKIEAEVEIKSDGDDILHMFGGQKAHHAPNHGPGIVPKLDLHHGESGAVGSMKIWTFFADGKVEKCKEKVTMADYDKKIVKLEAIEGDYINDYKQCIATYEVIQKIGASTPTFKITFEYEKQNPSVPVPYKYLDFFVALVKEVDSKIFLEKIEAEVEIKSDGEDILHMFGGERAHHAPTHGPGIVPELDLHHGESGAVGSIKIWTFYADGKVEKCKEKVTLADYDKKIVKLEAIEGDYIKEYKQCIATFEVIQKVDATPTFKITFEYEKQNPSVAVPNKYMDFFLALVKEVDSKIAKA